MRVYYLTGSQVALSNLALRRLRVSRFSDLNDPFELLAVDLAKKEHRTALRKTKERIDQKRGLICFTKYWHNPLVWGHYAEKHTGMCLGFDIPDQMLVPVIYAERPSKIRIDSKTNTPVLSEQVMNRLLRTKFADWKYEEEVRLFVELGEHPKESGSYFYSFSDRLVLREIILGPRCEIPLAKLRELVTPFEQPVQVIKSRIAFSSFRVVENRNAGRAERVGNGRT